MEMRNIHHPLASPCDQPSHAIHPQRKQEKTLPEIAPKTNQQQQTPIVQWPYTSQSATEQFMAVSMATQAASPPGLLNQWPPPFWHPQWPAGVVPFVTGPNSSSIVQGGTSSTTQTQIPNMCYPFGYTFPGFPGPCDPSSWLGLMQQLQHPYFYHFPGAPGFSSATLPMLGCSASGEQSLQSGIIIPTTKLSLEHEKLWEAQSEENARLHSVISKLQAEVSDYKDRLTKLEEASFKRKAVAPPNVVTGTTPLGTGQPRKRGRPRKTLANSVNALQVSLPQSQVVKPAPSKQHPFDIKSPIFEKVILKKAGSKDIPNRPPATIAQQQTNGMILNVVTDVSGNNLNQRKSMLSGERVYFETLQDLKNATSGLANEVTMTGRSISSRINGFTSNGNHGGASCIPCQKSARELLDAAHQGLFHSSFVQQEQGKKVTSGESGANEEESSEDMEDTNQGSGDENEEEMGDGTSSSSL